MVYAGVIPIVSPPQEECVSYLFVFSVCGVSVLDCYQTWLLPVLLLGGPVLFTERENRLQWSGVPVLLFLFFVCSFGVFVYVGTDVDTIIV